MNISVEKVSGGVEHTDTINLLNSLHGYVSLLAMIKTRELAGPQLDREEGSIFIESISLQDDLIRLKLEYGKKLPSSHRYLVSRYLECTFKIDQEKTFCTEFYYRHKNRQDALKNFILENAPTTWISEQGKSFFSEEIQQYLTIADEISKCAYQYSSGDDYHPGYYSEILMEENKIILRQINHWNSRSLNHRDDYNLRDLEFFIPLQPMEEKPSFHDYRIGKMFINFSDRSSENNKGCGDRIREMILEKAGG